MISYVKGSLVNLLEDSVIVESGHLGFQIFVPVSLLSELPSIGSEVLLHTYFQVREDAMSLYGFLSRQDLNMFRQFIGVNGIGPKAALGILSVLKPDELRLAIVSGDAKAISKAPGVGAKTAQRVILDLKDKIELKDILPGFAAESNDPLSLPSAGQEAAEALVALGYSGLEASKAVKKVEITEDMDSEAVLKSALKHLSFL